MKAPILSRPVCTADPAKPEHYSRVARSRSNSLSYAKRQVSQNEGGTLGERKAEKQCLSFSEQISFDRVNEFTNPDREETVSMLLSRAAMAGGILLLGACVQWMKAGEQDRDGPAEIEAFNKKFLELHLKMDTPGIMASWTEDGVDLMQG